MSRTLRRLSLALVCVLLIGGLLFAGPGHALLHADDHGAPCDACQLVQLEAPLAFDVVGPVELIELSRVELREAPRTHDVPAEGRPRAPPPIG